MISNPWDTMGSSQAVNSSWVLRYYMLNTFKTLIREHVHEERVTDILKDKGVDLGKVYAVKNLNDFDAEFT